MPVPDQVRDDGFGTQNYLNLMDFRLDWNDKKRGRNPQTAHIKVILFSSCL